MTTARGRCLCHAAVVFSVSVATAAGLSASTLDIVRQRLAQFHGTGAISGRVDIAAETSTAKARQSRTAAADFDCDPAALRLSMAGGELTQALASDKRERSLIDMADAWSRLNAAPALLRKLRRAVVLKEQPSVWGGQRATRLELHVDREDSGDVPKAMKMKMDETHVLWVAADGTPIAFDSQGKATVRFLVLSANASGHSVVEYAVSGDRLIISREVEESTSSGMGQNDHEKKTTTVTLRK